MLIMQYCCRDLVIMMKCDVQCLAACLSLDQNVRMVIRRT